ncbi:hypothetical protein H5410_015016 [Solanum commersonii]|uniref:Uncharacterized protein n=1 Tax=Solanum commersonii TaxID=4109 RepID=A0A9J5ZSN1_SOLCO|nr:hypothetical protein H5410_015016 [Solanum commersonii]
MLQRTIRHSKLGSSISLAILPLVTSITFLLWPSVSSSSVILGDPMTTLRNRSAQADCSFLSLT